MSNNKTFLYTIKLGHLGGKTQITKEYYSFNTFYIHGFRDKYGIITSSINKEFYRAMFLLSICWYNGGHLLIVNTNNKFSQLLQNLLQSYKVISNKTMQNKTYRPPARKYKKKFIDNRFVARMIKWDPSRAAFSIRDRDPSRAAHSFHRKKLSSTEIRNQISLTSSKIYGGTITNWKQLAKSISRGKIFEKKFGKFISKNNVMFPPYNKSKQSGVQLFETCGKQGSIRAGERNLSSARPDCILIIGGGSIAGTDILRNAFFLEIPTIVSVDSHTPVNFCTYPVWGNTVSVGFLLSLIEWFFRCSKQRPTPHLV